jgi:long-chain acyl-CoA synthetase
MSRQRLPRMIDLKDCESLGAALRASIERWSREICLIEADRERENCRLIYRQFGDLARLVARALESTDFGAGSRAAILMTNQSKWLIAAYAIFFRGGVLVPLDYKLTTTEQIQLLQHSGAKVVFAEYHLWRAITRTGNFAELTLSQVYVTDAPTGADLVGATRWESLQDHREPQFVPRRREDPACIVYSSGTGGRPKGCVLTHDNYLEQCAALTALFPFTPGVRYLSILPTNHAIDFMVGFIGPFVCGATVVHLRTLRPEYIREAFTRYRITHVSLVPLVLKNLERGLRQRFAELSAPRRFLLSQLIRFNRALTKNRPRPRISRALLRDVHSAFGGELEAMFVGGAFTEPATLQFFYDLGIVVANGYGCTEAGTALTLSDFRPFRSDTVGKPLPGVELRIVEPDADNIGEVVVRGRTVMAGYLDDPQLTAETIRDGWLHTGDLGRLDPAGHLRLFGRRRNMIVTSEGKNVYPEDIENAFAGLAVKEFCVFAANYLWPQREMTGEKLAIVLHPESGQTITGDVIIAVGERNRRLPAYKRVSGYLAWDRDFPRTASMKIKRDALAEEMRGRLTRESMTPL